MPQRLIRYMLFGIAVLGMLACDESVYWESLGASELCSADNGILTVYDLTLYVETGEYSRTEKQVNSVFQSHDGGLSWNKRLNIYELQPCSGQSIRSKPVLELIDTPQADFRVEANDGIYRIDADGTETKEFDLSFYRQEARIFIPQHHCNGGQWNLNFIGLPSLEGEYKFFADGVFTNAVFHPPTQNVLVLTESDGALVRTPDAIWRWVAIGDCRYLATQDPRNLLNILWPELWLMLPIIPLYALITARRLSIFRYLLMVIIVVPWMPALFLPRYTGDYIWLAFLFPIYVSALLSTLQLLWISYDKSLHVFTRLAMILGLFLAPYLLWVWGILPYHRLAAGISLGLTIWGLYRVYKKTRRPTPKVEILSEVIPVP